MSIVVASATEDKVKPRCNFLSEYFGPYISWKLNYMLRTTLLWCLFYGANIGWAAVSQPCYVIGWGQNISGQTTGVPQGNPPGTPNNSTGLVMVAGQVLTNVRSVHAGEGYGLALKYDGSVLGWGENSLGQGLGYRTADSFGTNGQVRVDGALLTNVAAISAGSFISLALLSNGLVVAWGDGPGRDGVGTPKVPPKMDTVIAVSAGTGRFLSLKKDGEVVQWNTAGDLEQVPSSLSNVVAIAAGRIHYGHNLAVRGDGTVVDWTFGNEYPVPVEATNVISVASGDTHNLALRRDGTVVGWGANRFGEATGIPTKGFPEDSKGIVIYKGKALENVVAIAAGCRISLALLKSGTVVAWGKGESVATSVPEGLTDITDIAAGDDFCLAITTNAAVAERFRH